MLLLQKCYTKKSGRDLRIGEVTDLQIELYESIEITPPTSLH